MRDIHDWWTSDAYGMCFPPAAPGDAIEICSGDAADSSPET